MKANRPMDEMAREHAARAIDTIAGVMDDIDAEDKDRIRAAESLLNRGYGLPAQAIIQIPATKRLAQQLASMSDEALVAVIESKQLPRLGPAQPMVTIEAAPARCASPHGPASDIYAAEPDPLLL
jgi:hypothetical protein